MIYSFRKSISGNEQRGILNSSRTETGIEKLFYRKIRSFQKGAAYVLPVTDVRNIARYRNSTLLGKARLDSHAVER